MILRRPLDRKLFRDLLHIWAQALAIAMVMASGVATLILAVGAQGSLEEIRSTYYERFRFADVFATVTRAPGFVREQLLTVDGVSAVETRIAQFALLDIPGMVEPANSIVLSLPDHRETAVNRLYMKTGRTPEPGRADEVTVNEAFALAHGFTLGSPFEAILNGRKRTLTIVGIALSPEYVYALGPGDLVPDDRRFAVLWMSEEALAGLFDLEGAFNSVLIKLLNGVNERDVIGAVDAILARYGSTGAYGREDQISHAFLDGELRQLDALARVIPPIFLAVSAFLINMILSRLIALEREQIGLLKALGYGRLAVATHYFKLILAITAVGILIGFAGGTWLGRGLTRLYADFFHFPFLIFRIDPAVYALAAGVTVLAGLAGGLRSVWSAASMPPAVAMQPPAPPRYRRLWFELTGMGRLVSQLTMMAVRNLFRWPLRAALTILGVAMSAALLVTSLSPLDSLDDMIDITYYRTERQDATITFTDEKGPAALLEAARLPGVMQAESELAVPVRLKNGHLFRRLAIVGKPRELELSRILDADQRSVAVPESGLLISERVAEVLDLKEGDMAEIEILEGRRGTVYAPVRRIIRAYFGLTVYMSEDALADMLDEGPRLSGVHVIYDRAEENALYRAIKALPGAASIALRKVSLQKFRETINENINIMISVYIVLGVVITFGVVYNSARIQLSERGRELASLRVLGFTRREVASVLMIQLVIIVVLAQPLGWVLGYGFSWTTNQAFSSDLYTVPFIVTPVSYARASLIVIAAAFVSAMIVRRRIDTLDLIAVLKTRE
ncbi:MAG TPA: FtsX-like permease family protein [Afifellaceae bacterium]|nr:FtsX-like permease family protein [Afifellaceae bacterium]